MAEVMCYERTCRDESNNILYSFVVIDGLNCKTLIQDKAK